MAFLLSDNDAGSYFKALDLMQSAGIYEDDEGKPLKDLYLLVDMLFDKVIINPIKCPVKTNFPLCIKAKENLMILLEKVKQMITDKNKQQSKVTGTCKKSNKKNIKEVHEDGKNKQQLQRLEAVIYLQLGKIWWRMDNLKKGEKELSKCWLNLENDDKDGMTIQVKQEVLNECGLLSLKQGNLEKSVMYFEEAKKLYENLKDRPSPWCVDDFFRAEAHNPQFNDDKKRILVFERNFTQTLFYLTFMNWKLKSKIKAAFCILQILSTQLDNHNYDVYDWYFTAAKLSQCFTLSGHFKMARHCMAAAETVLKQKGDCPSNLFVMVPKGLSKEEADAKRKVSKFWADLFHFWYKYCDDLFNFSMKLPRTFLDDSAREKCSFSLDVTECESQVRAEKVESIEDALEVVEKGQAWLNRCKEFYHFQGYCTEYVDLVRKKCTLSENLSIYEPERQNEVEKCWLEIFIKLLSQVNQKLYPTICSQICLDIAESYCRISLTKCLETQLSQQPSTLLNKEKNSLAHKSIEYSERFLNYLRNPKGMLPETFEEECELDVVCAHFFIAWGYSSIKTEEPKELLLNYIKAINNFSFVVQYCLQHPSVVPKFGTKIDISVKRMSELSEDILERMGRL